MLFWSAATLFAMKKAWKVFRTVVSLLLFMAVGVPALLYVLLSIGGVQNSIRRITNTELSHVLGARVDIGRLSIRPFNRVMLSDISLTDSLSGDTLATVRRVSAGLELWRLIRQGEIVVDYAMVDGLNLKVWRRDSVSPLNIQPVIDHLRSDNPRQRETPFELRMNTVIVRRSSASYDVLSARHCQPGRFDPNHIAVSDVAINAYIPRISPHDFRIDLDHLSASERSGLELRRMMAKVAVQDSVVTLSHLSINLNRSTIGIEPLTVQLGHDLRGGLERMPLVLRTTDGTVVYPSDFAAFVPALGQLPEGFGLRLDLWCNADSVNLRRLEVRSQQTAGALAVRGRAWAAGLGQGDDLRYGTENLELSFRGQAVAAMAGGMLKPALRRSLETIQQARARLDARGTARQGRVELSLDCDSGLVAIDAAYRLSPYRRSFSGNVELNRFNLAPLAPGTGLGRVSGTLEGDVALGGGITGCVRANLDRTEYKNYPYSDLSVRIQAPHAGRCEATVDLNDPNAGALVYAFYDYNDSVGHAINATAALSNVNLEALGFRDPKPGYRMGVKLIAQLRGHNADDIAGSVDLTDIRWLDDRNQGLRIPRLTIAANPDSRPQTISISSDVIQGSISGRYALSALPGQLVDMAAAHFPALFPGRSDRPERLSRQRINDFDYDFTINSTEAISNFFGLGAAIVYPAQISGHIDSGAKRATLEVDAPYILQGDKIYNGTIVYVEADTTQSMARAYLTTQFPTKKGPMVLAGSLSGAHNRIDTRLDWTIQRRIPLNGTVDFSAELTGLPGRGSGRLVPVDATLTFNPGTVNFGNETWTIQPSTITSGPQGLTISHFALDSGQQHIGVDGIVSANAADTLSIDLGRVQLLPVFETLEIDKAMLSGEATGTFHASSLLGADRTLECPHLRVDGIGYNRCTIGDADILARWDAPTESFYLDADIAGEAGHRSRIAGNIFPMAEALDLSFEADSVPVGFLKPFMDAFARDITGRATGHCRLFGTFKEIDLTGDVWADNISMAVDFTNTVYTTSDSVHMRPGRIIVPRAVMRDPEGHTAEISGWVNHVFFKEPSYRFDVENARNFLAYNGSPAQNPDWYGTIYGNGTAAVYGEPGVVNIEADMSTGPRSTFTFVLSDRLDATDYSFINFRDATPDSMRVLARDIDEVPLIVREIQNRLAQQNQDEPSAYRMKLSVDITPQAQLILVMDAATGDEIKANGAGHMTMTYNSTDEDLRIYGAYALASGSYHFTLQDIIIKDFTIKEGSTINFDGDPYAVRADIQAYYATTANLSDLDQSFLQDREVARTKVPVHALMNVRGDIRQPEISFDLEFPTLTDDTYRKVRSIVSTSDMMNRQIIYLLALNRFYTPDYMSKTTKGSEWFSVASSTISSQLSSLLGKISDNWSIAPNVRSDRGDFSDVEFDVALSSRLLNNRLLFNGNFGYRDNTLNSNQFVGDFDIEYLINPRGTWRLKAYNRYNDANYYLRSAATTQGVGIVYRRDFDNIFSFLRPRKHTLRPAPAAPDTTAVENNAPAPEQSPR